MNFKRYMEALADFGFDRKVIDQHASQRPERENPIDTFNIEYMRDMLVERELGLLQPFSRFVNEVQWGTGVGAMRVLVDPKTGIYMDRLGFDLHGEPRWHTKKYFQVNRHGYGGYEEVVSQELFDRLEEVHKKPLDSPKSDYKDLKTLVIGLTERLRKEARPIFLFDRVNKINDNRYLICFDVRGQGMGEPGQKRVEKNVTDVNYYPSEGYIRVINYSYESTHGEHKWEIGIPDLDLCYFPTQPRDEIIDPIVTNLRFY